MTTNYPDLHRVALISGGVDSIVACLLAGASKTLPLFFNYGQKAKLMEYKCARFLAKKYCGIRLQRIKLPWYRSVVSPPICRRYSFLSHENRNVAYAPFRNSIFILIAAAIAEVNGYSEVIIGSHNHDTVYPDNSPEYIEAMNELISIAGMGDHPIRIISPVINMNKEEIIQKALEIGIPVENTWSCYNSNRIPCGVCLNCNERRNAFVSLGVKDPMTY